MIDNKNLGYVLVVDDDKASNYLAQILLEDLGLSDHIHTYTESKAAFNFIKELYQNDSLQKDQQHILGLQHIIFLDINMPIMGGFEFMEELGKIRHLKNLNIEVVMLTSSTYYKDIEKANSYNITTFLDKPLTEEKLIQVLENI